MTTAFALGDAVDTMLRRMTAAVVLIFGLSGCVVGGDDDGSQPIILDGCQVGGCSATVCSDDLDVVTTCEWLPEYECYRTATCERQRDGACGWTVTEDLERCIGDPRAD